MIQVAKFFNTAGPIQRNMHYHIDPLKRIELEEVEMLMAQRKYFVLHAPRQTGKTSCLLALRDYLNEQGIIMRFMLMWRLGRLRGRILLRW